MKQVTHSSLLVRQVFLTIAILTAIAAAEGTNGQRGLMRTLSAKTLGKTQMNIGAGVNYAQSSDFLQWINNPEWTAARSPADNVKLLSTNVYMGLGLTTFWDISLACPFYWDGADYYNGDFGVGDFEFSTKILYPRPDKPRLFYQAYFLDISAGLSNMSNRGLYPRHAYYYETYQVGDVFTAKGFVLKALMLWTFDIETVAPKAPLQININAGIAIPNSGKAISGLVNLAFEYTPADVITIFVDAASEIRGETVLHDLMNVRKEMLWVTPGIRINSPVGVYVTLAADLGLSDNANWRTQNTTRDGKTYSIGSVPPYGVQLAIGWRGFLAAQDDDRDGIKNDDDRCPKQAEDIDGFDDADGCPDYDNDKDGIPDSLDKCPNLAEDIDQFEDADGCPDNDNDKDGIPDSLDKCLRQAEDFDGFQDADGCPDNDNDKDGIADSLDKCPNDPEDFDSFQDADGCPDPDNDHDGIPDIRDKCPTDPETFNNYKDDDGCPDTVPVVVVKKKDSPMPKSQIVQGVQFVTGKAELTFESYPFLNPLVRELKEYTDIEIEIRGHTDSMGDFKANTKLSQNRADAVRQYLISQGVDAMHIRAVGFGSSAPIADNRTAAGRTQNRRIEVIRLK